MRVLVCGSRDWDDEQIIWHVLDGIRATVEDEMPFTIIEGEARGADSLARHWAEVHGAIIQKFPADWDQHGKAAGFIRNQQMIHEGCPHMVVAFSDLPITKGTEDMCKRARKAGVPVYVVSRYR